MTPTFNRRWEFFYFQEGVIYEVWGIAALWLGLALVATLLSIWFRIATALSEIVVGSVARSLLRIISQASFRCNLELTSLKTPLQD